MLFPDGEEEDIRRDIVKGMNFTPCESLEMIEEAMSHPIKLIVNALDTPPASLIETAHSKGIKVAALSGKPRHAVEHKEAGCDFVIAVGTEAGGMPVKCPLWFSGCALLTPLIRCPFWAAAVLDAVGSWLRRYLWAVRVCGAAPSG